MVTGQQTPIASAGASAPAGDLPTEVCDLVVTLGKAWRAFQFYQPNNPVYQRFIGALRDRFIALWDHESSIHFLVEDGGFRWEGELVAAGEGREGLAYFLYNDGIRSLTFQPGFEEEIERLLGVLRKARSTGPAGDDLVSLLWTEEFSFFQYGYADLLPEGVPLPERGGVAAGQAPASDQWLKDLVAEVNAPAAVERPPPAVTDLDFAETLYFLSEAEVEQLQNEVRAEMERDLTRDVLSALFDRLEEPEPERQIEILGILRQLLPIFLSGGSLGAAGSVLLETQEIMDANRIADSEVRAAVDDLLAEVSSETVLGQLIHLLESGAVQPRADQLAVLFAALRPEALPSLIRASEAQRPGAIRNLMSSAIDRLAQQVPSRVVALIREGDPVLALGAARVAGRLRIAEAVPPVTRLLDRPEPAARLAAVEALTDLRSAAAMSALDRALEDTDREVRIAAARALGSLRYAPARPHLEAVLQSKLLRDFDLTEKVAFFEAYGAVAGPEGVGLLDQLLNGRTFLGARQPTDVRACAALALGRIGSPAARTALDRSAEDPEPVVRSAVTKAMSERGRSS